MTSCKDCERAGGRYLTNRHYSKCPQYPGNKLMVKMDYKDLAEQIKKLIADPYGIW